MTYTIDFFLYIDDFKTAVAINDHTPHYVDPHYFTLESSVGDTLSNL